MPFHLLPTSTSCNRREFLGATTVALSLGPAVLAADDPSRPWYALISDTHIAADPKAQSRGQCMADNLRAVVADILAQTTPPAAAVIDGDLALGVGEEGDYRTFLSLVEPLRQAKFPLYLGLGNHDDRAHFRDVLRILPPAETAVEDKEVGIVDGPPMRWVILDSLDRTNVTPGLLGERQLGWLAKALDAEPTSPTLLFVHHNPERGSLPDGEAFLAMIRPRRQVKAVIFGHTHTWALSLDDGLHLINLPAVAYPFTKDQPLGWCRLTPTETGAEIELRCIGGDKKDDRRTTVLTWRP